MFKRKFFCLCLFFVGSLLIINSAYALLLSFSPPEQTVNKGAKAKVDLTIDTGGTILSGYDIMFEYDNRILSITNSDIELSTTLGALTLDSEDSEVDAEGTPDTIYISGSYNINGEIIQSSFLNLATFDFFAESEGTSDLEFSYIILYDELGKDYSFDFVDQISDNGSITVSSSKSIPEPATFLLLGSLLVGFAFFKEKKFNNS